MADKPQSSPLIPLPVVLGALFLLALGAGLYLLYQHSGKPAPGPALTGEAKAYVKHLGLSEVEMKATESYLGHEVVEILGKIENKGDRDLKQVDLTCVFYDPYGQVVLRQRVSIVRPRIGLKAGEIRNFRMPFDEIPLSWNKQMPQLVIAGIVF